MNHKFLTLAATLANKTNPHATSPNPRVGCVIVKDEKVIATGVHEKFGEAHAEANACSNLKSLTGCTVYITLEPCDHFAGKKTPSCTDLLILKRPDKVVIGSLDPKFNGQNIEKLRCAGISVETVADARCTELNPFFQKFTETKRPYVRLKLALSVDGKITNPNGKWISNEMSRARVHEMRANFSAILTTTKTILADDPLLNCRISGRIHTSNPKILVHGKKSDIPNCANIFSIPDREINFIESKDLKKMLTHAGELGIDSILTECGAGMCTALLSENLVDEICLFIAPNIFGKLAKNAFTTEVDLSEFKLDKIENLDGDVCCLLTKL